MYLPGMSKTSVVIDKSLRYAIIYNHEVPVVWLYIECINVWLVPVIDFQWKASGTYFGYKCVL